MTRREAHSTPRHPMRVVTRRTGLTPSALRAWERRYGAVQPGRSAGGQRLYSDADIERLVLLVEATRAGWGIGQVATMSLEELEALLVERGTARAAPERATGRVEESSSGVVREAIASVELMDAQRLQRTLTRAAVLLGPARLVDEVVLPTLDRIGKMWQHGMISPAAEHLASVVVRRHLVWLIETIDVPSDAPVLVCGTPPGHRHELGALLAAVVGAAQGWRSVFLGPDLPAEDIASAAEQLGASAVAVSAILPTRDPAIPREFAVLRSLLPRETRVFAGGGAVTHYRDDVEASGAEVLETLADLRDRLSAVPETSGAVPPQRR